MGIVKIVYCILHYKVMSITKNCVDAILQIDEDANIVIVDNASPDKSGSELLITYQKNSNIRVILLEENLGFARGNNVGYIYAKENLNADVIVVMNNDILLDEESFLQPLNEALIRTHADVIAPNIYNIHGFHQNPYRIQRIEKKEIVNMLFRLITADIVLSIPILNKCVINYKANKKESKNIDNSIWKQRSRDIVPHGSIIIFANQFVKNENNAFCPNTFMYCEEDILYEHCMDKKYCIVYEPDIHVTHLQGMSTASYSKDCIRKYKFIIRCKLASLKVLIKEMSK